MKNLKSFERKSILVIVVGFTGLFLLLHFFKDREAYPLLWIAGSVLILSLFSSNAAKAILWVWFGIAKILGWINSRIILTILFYLFLTPLSLLYRLFNKDQLKVKRPQTKSMYDSRNHTYTPEDLENMW